MWSMLLGLIPGLFSTVNGITNAIANERLALITAKTDQERIAAQENISVLQTRRDALIAKKSPMTELIMFILALGPGVILLKFFAWDKTMGSLYGCARTDALFDPYCASFRTDPLDANQWWVVIAVVGFYFLASFRK